MAGVGAAILAAGAGSRYTGPTHKLLAPYKGSTVIGHSVAAALAARFESLALVTGAVDLPSFDGVVALPNPDWADGQSTSLRVATGWADEMGFDAVVIGLGDQPDCPPAAWMAVALVFAPIVTATYGGIRRPPVSLAREVWPLLPTEGDEGARALMRARPDLVVEISVEGDSKDIDTVDDLE